MKRYFLFINDLYYPSTGMDDFIGDFDTIKDVKDEIIKKLGKHSICKETIVIWDSEIREIIYKETK